MHEIYEIFLKSEIP